MAAEDTSLVLKSTYRTTSSVSTLFGWMGPPPNPTYQSPEDLGLIETIKLEPGLEEYEPKAIYIMSNDSEGTANTDVGNHDGYCGDDAHLALDSSSIPFSIKEEVDPVVDGTENTQSSDESQTNLKKNRRPKLRCEFCDRDYYSYYSHRKFCVPSRKLQECNWCGQMVRCVLSHQKSLSCSAVSKYTCSLCDRRFKNRQVLLLHEKRKHVPAARNVCQRCGKRFHSKKLLTLHRKLNSCEKLRCDLCDLVVTTKSLYLKHSHKCGVKHGKIKKRELEVNKTFECVKCGLGELSKLELRRHDYICGPFACEVCGKSYLRSESLKGHKLTHGVSDKDTFKYDCEICGNKFQSPVTLKSHEKHVHAVKRGREKKTAPRMQCDACYSIVVTLESHHEQWRDKSSVCETCGKTLKLPCMMRKHRKYCKLVQCEICGEKFRGSYKLDRHRKKHSEPKQEHICETCGREVKSSGALKQHLRTHELSKVCEVCGERFQTKGLLQQHRRCHAEQWSMCDVCGKSVPPGNAFYAHMRSHQTVVCEICGKSVAKPRYRKHLFCHSTEEKFPCNVCGKLFTSPDRLRRHRRSHTEDAVCKVCERRFSTVNERKNHEYTHSGIKSFTCDVCGMSYFTKRSLKFHQKLKHESMK